MQLLACSDGGQNGGTAACEKRRREHQQRAEEVKHPGFAAVYTEDKTECEHGAHQVARDHDVLAVQAIEHHAGDGPREHGGDGARQHHSTHGKTGIGIGQHQAEDGDVIEMIADLTHHLAAPHVAVVGILPKKRAKREHQPRSVRYTPLKMTVPLTTSGAVMRSPRNATAMSVAITGSR